MNTSYCKLKALCLVLAVTTLDHQVHPKIAVACDA